MALVLAACASHSPSTKPAPGATPELLTVPQLQRMLELGETVGAILGRIDASGTVYRLTTEQRAGLRAAGMPAAILGKIEITYQHAITANPALAKSDDRWIKRGDYWYGGLPAGWPREWVVGAPAPGEVFR
jgi:hypothetical protein